MTAVWPVESEFERDMSVTDRISAVARHGEFCGTDPLWGWPLCGDREAHIVGSVVFDDEPDADTEVVFDDDAIQTVGLADWDDD